MLKMLLYSISDLRSYFNGLILLQTYSTKKQIFLKCHFTSNFLMVYFGTKQSLLEFFFKCQKLGKKKDSFYKEAWTLKRVSKVGK